MSTPEESKFVNCTIPITFEGRYFVLEPGNSPLYSVVNIQNGKAVTEIRKNEPVGNSLSDITKTETGAITCSEKKKEEGEGEEEKEKEVKKGKVIYKLTPGTETRIAFPKDGGGEIPIVIWDKKISVAGITLDDCALNDVACSVEVFSNGGFQINASIPRPLIRMIQY